MSDVSQVHQTEHQKLAPMKDEDNEESESIKEEQEEYFITVGKLHIEEQQRPLIKVSGNILVLSVRNQTLLKLKRRLSSPKSSRRSQCPLNSIRV
ncbi:uncharacterized protein LOC144091820 isoform X2 [Stigmatopora argus]